MTAADREKWDERYRAGAYADRTHPSRLLAQHIASLPRGRALDVACGAGRNALFLASMGYAVDAIDISAAALERARRTALAMHTSIEFFEQDLDTGLPAAVERRSYDVIVFVRYVNTPLLSRMCANVAPGGALCCEEHLETAHEVAGPSGSSHRLRRGELASAIRSLDLRYYREGLIADPDGRRMSIAQAIATRGGTFEIEYC